MITQGHRPSGYFVTLDEKLKRVEGETRTCVHCQYTWEYVPGSGHVRGFCLKCNGITCQRPSCVTRGCVPFEAQWDAWAAEADRINRLVANGAVLL